uniref:Macaca fascicularis brain cDNA clone: QccE-18462, similar to human regulating synaptic membrane exocytosis 4 (RIMS4), mRNA, RefSeq: NM_182970.2 n=1 Tax=Macaca fascicularis TaxID=9541 RepID=I7GKD5_MACFA|nr:unnamed protein product [Macaca fascicularis]
MVSPRPSGRAPRLELAPQSGRKVLASTSSPDAEPVRWASGAHLTQCFREVRVEPNPGLWVITSGALSLYDCFLGRWREGRSPGSLGWGPLSIHPPFPHFLLLEQELPRPLGREGFWGPWVGVGSRCIVFMTM